MGSILEPIDGIDFVSQSECRDGADAGDCLEERNDRVILAH